MAAAALPADAAINTLTASSISSQAIASSIFDAPLLEWQTEDQPAGALAFYLTAKHVKLEEDRGEFFQAGTASIGTNQPTTTVTEQVNSEWTATNWFDRTDFFVIPREASLNVTGAELDLSIPLDSCLQQFVYMPSVREPLCPPLAQALSASLHDGTIELSGNFDVFLWGWRGTIASAQGGGEFWTGTQYSTPDASPSPTGPSERRFAKLEVTDGRLLVNAASTPLNVYPVAISLDVAHLTLNDAAYVRAENATAEVTRAGSLLAIEIGSGKFTDQSGGTVVFASNEDNERWFGWWIAGLVVPAILAAWLSRRPTYRLRSAAENLAIGNPSAAYRHARLAVEYPWTRRKAQTLSIIALLRSKRFAQAGVELDAARDRGMDEATADFMEAFLHASTGQVAAAEEALGRCIASDPAFGAEAAKHPVLAPVLHAIARRDSQ